MIQRLTVWSISSMPPAAAGKYCTSLNKRQENPRFFDAYQRNGLIRKKTVKIIVCAHNYL